MNQVLLILLALSPGVLCQCGYDLAGNRTFARVANGPLADQDWLYTYDALDRLQTAGRGTLNAAGSGFLPPPALSPEVTRWVLDDLGNWSAGAVWPGSVLPGSVFTFLDWDLDREWDTSGQPETYLGGRHHAVDESNEIDTLVTTDGISPATEAKFAYDAAGNLLLDGEHFYRYDAFNRLVAVYEPETVAVQADGTLRGEPGTQLVRYAYDAVGRRVKTVVLPGGNGELVTRHVYGSGASVLAEYDVNSDGLGGREETLLNWYVHGDSAGQGFPDPVLVVSGTGSPAEQWLWYLKDVLGSVGALTDANEEVVERYTYTPYGETSIFAPNGTPRQGPWAGNPFAFTGQRLDPPTGLYHLWARSYDPRLGRFLQADLQGPLSLVDVFLPTDGHAPSVSGISPYAGGEYADGMNLFQYVGSNPATLNDPFGLSWDEDIDEAIAGMGAERAAAAIYALEFLQGVGQAAAWMAFEVTVTALVPGAGLVFAAMGVDASLQSISDNGLTWGNGFSLAANMAGMHYAYGRFNGQLGRYGSTYGRMRAGAIDDFARAVGRTVGHHTVPVAVLEKLPSKVANNPLVRGTRGKPNIWQVPEGVHKGLHGGGPHGGQWNARWWEELHKTAKVRGGLKNVTADDVVMIRESLVGEFGLESYRP